MGVSRVAVALVAITLMTWLLPAGPVEQVPSGGFPLVPIIHCPIAQRHSHQSLVRSRPTKRTVARVNTHVLDVDAHVGLARCLFPEVFGADAGGAGDLGSVDVGGGSKTQDWWGESCTLVWRMGCTVRRGKRP